MTRVGFSLKVKEELRSEYVRRHQDVWPEMLDALRRSGWHNYTIFIQEDGTLFGYFETHGSFDDALTAMDREEVNARWQDEMAPFFEGVGAHADQMMIELKEVFHLD